MISIINNKQFVIQSVQHNTILKDPEIILIYITVFHLVVNLQVLELRVQQNNNANQHVNK